MANKITKDPLIENMIEKLKAFNNEGIEINNNTVHNTVLADNDGFQKIPPSKQQYQDSINWTIHWNGGTQLEWPEDWMDWSVSDLADFIISKQVYE